MRELYLLCPYCEHVDQGFTIANRALCSFHCDVTGKTMQNVLFSEGDDPMERCSHFVLARTRGKLAREILTIKNDDLGAEEHS